MAGAVARCVHCGFCLATCPTYLTMGEEMDSPRGRILSMKEVLEGSLTLAEALPHLDPCLGCVACETSCPSGVPYGELVTPFRAWSEERRVDGGWRRRRRRALLRTLQSPEAFRRMARLGRWARPFSGLLPASLRAPLDLLPKGRLQTSSAPRAARPVERPRARVALLRGCVQSVLRPSLLEATVEVLRRNRVEVWIPDDQGCCGALALHSGEAEMARDCARQTLRAFPLDEIDAVITNAAGCGSGMREYGALFEGQPESDRALRLAQRVVDVTTFLAELGLEGEPALPETVRVAYHDACHLAHAQHERSAPRALLRAVRGVELVEPREWEVCCGSAGLYNLDQPLVASELGERKAARLAETGAQVVASGNIGCLVQIARHLPVGPDGSSVPVLHTIEILAQGYRGEALRGVAE